MTRFVCCWYKHENLRLVMIRKTQHDQAELRVLLARTASHVHGAGMWTSLTCLFWVYSEFTLQNSRGSASRTGQNMLCIWYEHMLKSSFSLSQCITGSYSRWQLLLKLLLHSQCIHFLKNHLYKHICKKRMFYFIFKYNVRKYKTVSCQKHK